MPPVESTQHVTASELKAKLLLIGWDPKTVMLLFVDGRPPVRVQVGGEMYVVK